MRNADEVLKERNAQIGMTDRNVQMFVVRAQQEMEFLIMATPTGPAREALTEANIHLGAALDKLKTWRNSM